MATKIIACDDCEKVLAYLKGVPDDLTVTNPTRTLCYECASVRWKRERSEKKVV